MNYRHAFHAGNFADLVKHAALLHLLERLKGGGPITVVDTHAGAGLYDLAGAEAQRSGEAAAGVARLMAAKDAPSEFCGLIDAVKAANPSGALNAYPGSPWLIARQLGPADKLIACELEPQAHRALAQALKGRPGVETLGADGYRVAAERVPPKGAALVHVDPPFERADDYRRAVEVLAAVLRRNREAAVMIWLPLKDLETFDAFLRDAESQPGPPLLVAETRLRPLSDPMKMNGCALLLANAPKEMAAPLQAICGWTAERVGEAGEARVWPLR